MKNILKIALLVFIIAGFQGCALGKTTLDVTNSFVSTVTEFTLQTGGDLSQGTAVYTENLLDGISISPGATATLEIEPGVYYGHNAAGDGFHSAKQMPSGYTLDYEAGMSYQKTID